MAKDLEMRFSAAMKKGEKADKLAQANMKREKEQSKQVHPNVKRTTSDGYMPRKLEVKHEEGGKLYKMKNPVAGSKDEVKITGKGGFAKNFKKEKKTVEHFKAIKEHVSGGKKSGGFNDPFWYSKK